MLKEFYDKIFKSPTQEQKKLDLNTCKRDMLKHLSIIINLSFIPQTEKQAKIIKQLLSAIKRLAAEFEEK